ncbi:hypothetical protein [Lentibacillus cibarius]|uniref:Uncharacterized protein n=1 Tax=Lentibacillus cibarius TaxID=2583219 RepID=A0A5S3QL48_9BACI|nr:hypothetical protein [Lentibacillus cibarius]TMN22478.1 hypothetical protein FFL34_10410 [Lentibacillus cibarius]
MNRFAKLVNFELGRFMKIYLVLVAMTVVVQVAGVIVKANKYMSKANTAIYEEMLSRAEFIERYGQMGFMEVTRSLWFMGPIAICTAALIFYVFMIWYRDWFGKNTFIYRLLMLPTARLNVYMSKLIAIFLMVLGLVSVQLIILPLENSVLKWLVPTDFRSDMTVSQIINGNPLSILVPQTFTEFVLYYGAGFMALTIAFTAILFERSFKWKGIIAGIGYVAISVVLFIAPVLSMLLVGRDYLYTLEILGLEIVMGGIVTVMSIWVGNFLLNRKITV